MERAIDGFHRDDEGDWVAELECGHSQHVRHRPPFQVRTWVLDEQGRRSRIGAPLECPLCDHPDEPEGGDPACYAHLVCPGCGALIDHPGAHRPGCELGAGT